MTTPRDALAQLRARAQKLAQVETPEPEGATAPFVAFTLGGHGLAVPLSAVLHAGRLRHLTAVPGTDACLLGVTALGGHLVSVVDAAALLGLPRRGLHDLTACLVVRHADRKLGLGADQLLGIEDIAASCIHGLPAEQAGVWRVALLPKRQLLLLDLPRLLLDGRLTPD